MMEGNMEQIGLAAITGAAAWFATFLGHAFRFGGRLARIEAKIEALGEKLDLMFANQNANIEILRQTVGKAEARLDRMQERTD